MPYDWNGSDEGLGDAPNNLSATINISWTASQPVGKNKIIQATFESDHMATCYNTYSGWPQSGPDGYSWITSNFGSPETPFYVYSPNGKFSPGPVHVDVWTGETAYMWISGEPMLDGEGNHVTIEFYKLLGYDLKAVRSR